MSITLWAQPIEALGPRIRAKALSPVELTQACLDRIAQVDDRLLSFICLAPDALEQARRAETEIARGDWLLSAGAAEPSRETGPRSSA